MSAPGSSPRKNSRAEPTKSHNTSSDRWTQVSLDEVTSLTWVHDRDKDYYHDPYCEYLMSRPVRTGDALVSRCGMCGRTVESTLATYKVIKNA